MLKKIFNFNTKPSSQEPDLSKRKFLKSLGFVTTAALIGCRSQPDDIKKVVHMNFGIGDAPTEARIRDAARNGAKTILLDSLANFENIGTASNAESVRNTLLNRATLAQELGMTMSFNPRKNVINFQYRVQADLANSNNSAHHSVLDDFKRFGARLEFAANRSVDMTKSQYRGR